MDAQIAALGPRDFVMPFGAIGAKSFVVEDGGQAREQAQAILKENYAVILIHEGLAEALADIFESVQEQPSPCIVALPFIEESTGRAVQQLRTALRRATGTDIWNSAVTESK
jgi:vacuolar-type H+-ATPase subunit F/Vma7